MDTPRKQREFSRHEQVGFITRTINRLSIAALAAISFCCVACSHRRGPQAILDHAKETFWHGDVAKAEVEAEQGYKEFHNTSTEWAWQFTLLKARVSIWDGNMSQALDQLNSESAPLPVSDLAVQKHRLSAVSYAALRKFSKADSELSIAQNLCEGSPYPSCKDMPSTRGVLAARQGFYSHAQLFFEQALASARIGRDPFLEANILLNLSWVANEQNHLDEAIDWSAAAREISVPADFSDLSQTALGNMGWAYYKLGDFEKAEDMFSKAKDQAHKLSDETGEGGWLAALGYLYVDIGRLEEADRAFRGAYELSKKIDNREDLTSALQALAFLSEHSGKLADAKQYDDEALLMARSDGHRPDEIFARLVQGRIAADEHDATAAEAAFHEVDQSDASPAYLKWDAQHSLAQLYEKANHTEAAEDEYRIAIGTFESARSDLKQETSKLPFLSNASAIYDDYIHFLVIHGKTDEALQVAEFERGRTLSEGLGLLDANVSEAGPAKSGVSKSGKSQSGSSKTKTSQRTVFKPGDIDPQATARRAGGTILFYALGEKQSYLWAISPQKTSFFTLPPKSEIDPTVQRYGKVLANHQEFAAGKDARTLYQMLVAPAQAMLPKDATVFIIPDGSLNMLNFETLQVDEPGNPEPHYWIEDATIADASSLRMLGASRSADPHRLKPRSQVIASGTAGSRALPNLAHPGSAHPNSTHTAVSGTLLLMGDAVAASADYPELREASVEIKRIEKHFPDDQQQVFAREKATPAAYLASNPDQFSYIHFVAHGTASRTSPLDSAIVLSSTSKKEDSFKLYARDIIRQSLHAQLVTISACYGAGVRAYSGEGLVGLSWAFLHAGSHNVIGALWEVSDESTPELMDALYDGLSKGQSPASALRAAKLSLLHSNRFDKPFYWAPFQLYTGL